MSRQATASALSDGASESMSSAAQVAPLSSDQTRSGAEPGEPPVEPAMA